MSLVCALLTFWYTLRTGFRVSGHEYGEPVYEIRERQGLTVEVESLVCLRCGDVSEAWRRLP